MANQTGLITLGEQLILSSSSSPLIGGLDAPIGSFCISKNSFGVFYKNGASTSNWVLSNVTFITPESFGALGDGSTDDSSAIQSAINTGYPVYLTGGKNYRIATALSIVDNRGIVGTGNGAKISTASNINIFTITGSNNTFFNLNLEGSVVGGAGAANFGIWADGNAGLTLYRTNNKISLCNFTNLYYGIGCRNMVGTSSGALHEGSYTISDSSFSGCLYGFNALTRGEYNTISNCKFFSNTTAVSLTGGNNSISNCSIVDNTTGLEVLNGTNDGHSVASGCMINHNTVNLRSTSSLGYTYSGCMFFAGAITLTGTGKSKFVGCEFSMATFNFTITNSPCFMYNCEFTVVPNNFNLTGTPPTMVNCYSGTSLACYPNRLFAELTVLTANTTIAIPFSYMIESISFRNNTANAVTGGIKIGTTNGGTEVVVAQAVGANELVQVTSANLLKALFATNATTTLFIQAVTSWNSANVSMVVKLKQLVF